MISELKVKGIGEIVAGKAVCGSVNARYIMYGMCTSLLKVKKH